MMPAIPRPSVVLMLALNLAASVPVPCMAQSQPAVDGIVSLNNFPRKPLLQVFGTYNGRSGQLTRKQPQFTTPFQGGTAYAVGPADFGTIYNVQSLPEFQRDWTL